MEKIILQKANWNGHKNGLKKADLNQHFLQFAKEIIQKIDRLLKKYDLDF